jgi:hypothetical protein
MFKFTNGDTVKDTITGFSGVIVHRTEYLNGCIRYGVQPKKLKDGKTIESEMFDEQQLSLVSGVKKNEPKRTGGDRKAPARIKDIPPITRSISVSPRR